MAQVGTVSVVATIDTSQYKRGAKEVEAANKGIEGSVDKSDSSLGKLNKRLSGMARTGLKVATGGFIALGAAVATMTIKGGISRALNIEDAQAKLKGLGHDAESVETIMNSALDSVKGTAYGLDAAATIAASAVAAGVKPGQELTKYLGTTADAATIAGVSLSEMGSIFNKVQTQQKVYTQELNQLADRGIPIYQWLQDELGVTQEKLREMVAAGEVDAEVYFKAVQKNIGGAALESGKTTRGAWQNMLAAMSRVGERIVKGPIDTIRDGFGDMTKWIDRNADTIVSTVQGAMRVVSTAVTTTAGVLRTLSPLIAAGAAAWVAYKAAVIGVAAVKTALTSRIIAMTAAQKALNIMMAANPIGLVTAALGGMVAALVVSNLTTDRAKNSTSRLTEARQAAKVATDSLKESEDALTGAQLSAEGAEISLGRARERLTELQKSGTASSLDLREAAYNLKRAEDDLRVANEGVTKATDDKLRKEKEVADARNEVAKAEEDKRKQFSLTTVQINTQKTALERLREQLQKDYTPTQAQKNSQTLQNNLNKSAQPRPLGQRYLGGPVSAGRTYLVGENRDGSLNDTTELFVPNQSGRIINSQDFQDALGSGGKASSGIINNIQNITIASEIDGERWLRRLSGNQEIVSNGLVPTQSYM